MTVGPVSYIVCSLKIKKISFYCVSRNFDVAAETIYFHGFFLITILIIRSDQYLSLGEITLFIGRNLETVHYQCVTFPLQNQENWSLLNLASLQRKAADVCEFQSTVSMAPMVTCQLRGKQKISLQLVEKTTRVERGCSSLITERLAVPSTLRYLIAWYLFNKLYT